MANIMRFWEKWRIVYNLVLMGAAGLAVLAMVIILPSPWQHASWSNTLWVLLVCLVVSNVFYSVAYLPELVAILLFKRALSQPIRWTIFALGSLLVAFFGVVMGTMILAPDPG